MAVARQEEACTCSSYKTSMGKGGGAGRHQRRDKTSVSRGSGGQQRGEQAGQQRCGSGTCHCHVNAPSLCMLCSASCSHHHPLPLPALILSHLLSMLPSTCDRAHTLSLPLPIPRSCSHKMRALNALHSHSHKTSVSLYPLAATAHPFPHSYPLAAAADLHLCLPRRVQVWPLSMLPPTLPALVSSRCCCLPCPHLYPLAADADPTHTCTR